MEIALAATSQALRDEKLVKRCLKYTPIIRGSKDLLILCSVGSQEWGIHGHLRRLHNIGRDRIRGQGTRIVVPTKGPDFTHLRPTFVPPVLWLDESKNPQTQGRVQYDSEDRVGI